MFMNYWMHQYRKYCKKINSTLAQDDTANSEKFILDQISWVFESGADKGIDCLKKQNSFEVPYMSDKILQFVKKNGDFKAVI